MPLSKRFVAVLAGWLIWVCHWLRGQTSPRTTVFAGKLPAFCGQPAVNEGQKGWLRLTLARVERGAAGGTVHAGYVGRTQAGAVARSM